MAFQISSLPEGEFAHLHELSDRELQEHGAVRMHVGVRPGFPCRVTLEDAELGEKVILVNYVHLSVATPYRSSHAVFVREKAVQARPSIDEVPESLRIRLLSIRAFDEDGMMRDADVVHGRDFETAVERLFENPAVEYLHVHNAKPGCYAARVDRA
ncbi:MAG: DUF1203 domain-containing protein [Woeseiaceae bacterium]|nr:DUF1203 domain-containing protein [Woeseiaceae bacterium]